MTLTASEPDAPLIASRPLAAGEGWSFTEFVCSAGPQDRPFEERHESYSIAAVIAGQFAYRGDRGAGYLVPGALLTGNSGRCFRCAHEHGVGDLLREPEGFSEELAAEAAAAITGRTKFAFDAPSLPPSDAALPIVAGFQARVRRSARFRSRRRPTLVDAGTRCRRPRGTRRQGGEAPNARETQRVAAAIQCD